MSKKRLIDIKPESVERALLVAVDARRSADRRLAEESLDELGRLAGAAGAEVVGKLTQRLIVPSKTHYLGEGKLAELLSLKSDTNYNIVIFDDELSPLQQRNVENFLKVKVIDRVALILDIFARRAQTREGQLQIELAQHQYLYPRIAGQWSHLERLGGGIGTRGPGEAQIETDRRLIQKKIHRLKTQIEQVRKHRLLYRQKRRKSGIPVVALVGYTNAGKSTLLNTLSQANVSVEDKLFVTLDPTTRRLSLPDNCAVLITDTVGFIRKLPPSIVNAFRATLEELSEASVLLHVVDFSSPYAAEQCQAVEDILEGLDLTDKPRITAMNKIDLVLDRGRDWSEREALKYFSEKVEPADNDTVFISAGKKWGFSGLLELISRILARTAAPV
ncbi:GTPase HflX [Chloroflexota bacterium]